MEPIVAPVELQVADMFMSPLGLVLVESAKVQVGCVTACTIGREGAEGTPIEVLLDCTEALELSCVKEISRSTKIFAAAPGLACTTPMRLFACPTVMFEKAVMRLVNALAGVLGEA